MIKRREKHMEVDNWFDKFIELVGEKEQPIYYRHSSAPSRRISGQYGSSRKFYGFRSVLLYFQLSPEYTIKNKDLAFIFNYLEDYTHPRKTGVRRFMTLFLNDSEYKLLHPGEMSNNISLSIKDVKEYFDKYAKTHYQYSKKLTQLFPPLYFHGRENFPSDKDLCLMFQDKDGIKIDKEIKPHYDVIQNNWIWITLDKDKIISVNDGAFMQESMKE